MPGFMPELPEVETVVRGLRPLLVGRRIGRITVRQPRLRWPVPEDLGQRLTGARVAAVRRRAKYGLIDTDRADSLLFHLGMSGKFHVPAAAPGKHDHVLLEAGGRTLAFHDPRRFGSLHLLATAEEALHPLLKNLGPEPFSAAFSAHHLLEVAAGRKVSLKALLLDQHVVAGIGNIYASEALYLAAIDPARAAGTLTAGEALRLADSVWRVLEEAIEAGGSTLRDHAQLLGESGYFQHSFRVYGRDGLACPGCGRPVRRIVQNARSTFCCPACQR